jgi:PAS domain S-box-containing protein
MTYKKRINFYLTLCIFCFALPPLVVLADQDSHHPRTLQTASEFDYPPFAVVKPDGTADGFSVDLLKAVAKTINHKLNISVGPWSEIKKQLEEGKLDVLPLVAQTKERDKIYDFTVPYLQMHGTIFVRKGEKSISTEKDLKDKEVLVMRGDSSYEYAISRNISTKLVQTDSFEEAMKLLSSGRHDAVLCQYLMGLQLIKKLKIKNVVSVTSTDMDHLKPKSLVLSGFEQKFCIAVPEGQTELLRLLNEGLAIVFADGTYQRLYEKWFEPILPKPAVPVTIVIKYVFSILAPLLLFVAVIGIWYLRHKVATKTQSLRDEIKTREKAEVALGESHATIKQILDTLPQLIYWKDLEGIYLGCNNTFANACGFDSPELIKGKSDYDLPWTKASADGYRADDEEVIQKKQVKRHIVKPLRLADGTTLLSDNTKLPLRDVSGNIIGVLGVSSDITERRNVEEKLRQTQKMESIGNLAGGIAHDLNNILSVILGFTELALGALDKETPVREDLQEVYAASLRAKELVNQILTFARQSDEELKPIQVDFIIKEVLKFIRSSIPTTIEIKHNIASASYIMGNTTQIHRIMMNLCTNAAHAMENNGGTLEITLRDITIDRVTMRGNSQLKLGNYIEIRVSDTGDGIDSQVINKIFDPYYTTKGQGEGTGMGLAMVHGIVDTYGGKIFVESSLGKGTIFTINLPVARESKAHQQHQEDELPSGQERILFVDDEAQIAKMANRILSQLGYSVITKTSSTEALELFRSKPDDFDLVISDVTMPKMTGDQLTQELLQIRPDIPVILCTGYSKRLSEGKASEIGVKAFAYKPIVKEDLAKTVRDVLDLAKD